MKLGRMTSTRGSQMVVCSILWMAIVSDRPHQVQAVLTEALHVVGTVVNTAISAGSTIVDKIEKDVPLGGTLVGAIKNVASAAGVINNDIKDDIKDGIKDKVEDVIQKKGLTRSNSVPNLQAVGKQFSDLRGRRSSFSGSSPNYVARRKLTKDEVDKIRTMLKNTAQKLPEPYNSKIVDYFTATCNMPFMQQTLEMLKNLNGEELQKKVKDIMNTPSAIVMMRGIMSWLTRNEKDELLQIMKECKAVSNGDNLFMAGLKELTTSNDPVASLTALRNKLDQAKSLDAAKMQKADKVIVNVKTYQEKQLKKQMESITQMDEKNKELAQKLNNLNISSKNKDENALEKLKNLKTNDSITEKLDELNRSGRANSADALQKKQLTPNSIAALDIASQLAGTQKVIYDEPEKIVPQVIGGVGIGVGA